MIFKTYYDLITGVENANKVLKEKSLSVKIDLICNVFFNIENGVKIEKIIKITNLDQKIIEIIKKEYEDLLSKTKIETIKKYEKIGIDVSCFNEIKSFFDILKEELKIRINIKDLDSSSIEKLKAFDNEKLVRNSSWRSYIEVDSLNDTRDFLEINIPKIEKNINVSFLMTLILQGYQYEDVINFRDSNHPKKIVSTEMFNDLVKPKDLKKSNKLIFKDLNKISYRAVRNYYSQKKLDFYLELLNKYHTQFLLPINKLKKVFEIEESGDTGVYIYNNFENQTCSLDNMYSSLNDNNFWDRFKYFQNIIKDLVLRQSLIKEQNLEIQEFFLYNVEKENNVFKTIKAIFIKYYKKIIKIWN